MPPLFRYYSALFSSKTRPKVLKITSSATTQLFIGFKMSNNRLWISWVKKKMGNETAWILASALLGTFKADVQVGAWGQLIGKTLYRCFLKCLLLECSVLPNDPCESAARRLGLLSNAGDGRRGTIFSSFGSSAGDLREPLDLLHGYHFSKQIS